MMSFYMTPAVDMRRRSYPSHGCEEIPDGGRLQRGPPLGGDSQPRMGGHGVRSHGGGACRVARSHLGGSGNRLVSKAV